MSLPLPELTAHIEALLASGEMDMSAIELSVYQHFKDRIDPDYAIKAVCAKRTSLAVVNMRSESGERQAFPIRIDDSRKLAHMQHNCDRALWLAVSEAHANKAKEHQKIADRAYRHAAQMELFVA